MGEGLRKWLRVRGVSVGTPPHLTCRHLTTPDKMADFVVNRPHISNHQKIFTNSQQVPQSAVNSFISQFIEDSLHLIKPMKVLMIKTTNPR
jgi:hypothetical protein